jgi:protein tyrosine phosphatase
MLQYSGGFLSLPVHEHQVRLSEGPDGQQDYINAVWLHVSAGLTYFIYQKSKRIRCDYIATMPSPYKIK